MRIYLKNSTMTTIDNFQLKAFKAGEIVDLRESAACRLIARGDALYLPDNINQNGHCFTVDLPHCSENFWDIKEALEFSELAIQENKQYAEQNKHFAQAIWGEQLNEGI